MAKWIKGTEEYTNGPFTFQGEDGNEYVAYSPTPDFLEEQGWTKVEDDEVKPELKSIRSIKDSIIQECNEFYRSSILQVMFKGQILWVPFEVRQAYRTLLEDLKKAHREQVVFRDVTLAISEALDILRALNLYEYDQKQVCDRHVRNIIKLQSEEELYSYDFTSDYADNLSF